MSAPNTSPPIENMFISIIKSYDENMCYKYCFFFILYHQWILHFHFLKRFTKFSSSYEKTCSSNKRVQDKTPSRNLINYCHEVQNRILKMMWSLKSRVQWKDWTLKQSTCARLAISKLSSGSLGWNIVIVVILHFHLLILCLFWGCF